MQANAYLMFDGNCDEAFKFYAKCFGAKAEGIMTYGDSPMGEQTPPDFKGKVMHGRLVVGDTVIMASDAPHGQYEKPQGMSVALGLTDPAEAERIFKDLSKGGTVIMEAQQTFWSPMFGMCVDRFGIPWMVNCEPKA